MWSIVFAARATRNSSSSSDSPNWTTDPIARMHTFRTFSRKREGGGKEVERSREKRTDTGTDTDTGIDTHTHTHTKKKRR